MGSRLEAGNGVENRQGGNLEIEDAVRTPDALSPAPKPAALRRRVRVFAIVTVLLLMNMIVGLWILDVLAPESVPELRVDITTPVMPDPSAFAMSPRWPAAGVRWRI
jgi:hypothetical protein